MRIIVFSVLVLGWAGCSRHNPESCCVTEAQCAAFGLDHAYPCTAGNVCNASGACVAPECTTSNDCSGATPYCSSGLCVPGCASDNDCTASSATPYCGPDQVCVECTQSSQCPAEMPTCDGTSHQCTSGGAGGDAGVDGPKICVPELLFQRGGLFDHPQVYRVRLDDYQEHLVSDGTDTDIEPVWSPDGTRIAVARNGNSIWTVGPDGGSPHQVASYSGSDSVLYTEPAWSPDGARIAWMSDDTTSGEVQIFSALAIGSSGTNLVPGSNDAEGPMEYSPDASKVLYISKQTGDYDVFVVPSTGGGGTNLTHRVGDDGKSGAHWSPDGKQIVFGGGNHVWVMDADGSNLRNLTGTTGQQDEPIWSHDGTKIYYQASGNQLFVMNADGADQHAIETNSAIDENPVPSPDGSMIAWVSYRDGNGEIYVAGADGSNPTRVTNNSAVDLGPRWRPCP